MKLSAVLSLAGLLPLVSLHAAQPEFSSRAVTEMAVDRLTIPVLVVHHEEDACRVTLYRDVPRLIE